MIEDPFEPWVMYNIDMGGENGTSTTTTTISHPDIRTTAQTLSPEEGKLLAKIRFEQWGTWANNLQTAKILYTFFLICIVWVLPRNFQL